MLSNQRSTHPHRDAKFMHNQLLESLIQLHQKLLKYLGKAYKCLIQEQPSCSDSASNRVQEDKPIRLPLQKIPLGQELNLSSAGSSSPLESCASVDFFFFFPFKLQCIFPYPISTTLILLPAQVLRTG